MRKKRVKLTSGERTERASKNSKEREDRRSSNEDEIDAMVLRSIEQEGP